jgi:hypothetical protein
MIQSPFDNELLHWNWGRRENFWGISCEKSRFYAKKSYFFQLRKEVHKLLGYFVWKIDYRVCLGENIMKFLQIFHLKELLKPNANIVICSYLRMLKLHCISNFSTHIKIHMYMYVIYRGGPRGGRTGRTRRTPL